MYYTEDFINNHLFETYGVEYHFYEGIYTRLHNHDGYWECFLVTNGRMAHSFRDEKTVLEKNALCLMRPGDTHCFLPCGSTVARHINIAINDATFEAILNAVDKNMYPALLSYDGLLSYSMSDRQVDEFFANMQDLLSSPFTKNDLIAITLKLKFAEIAEMIYSSKCRNTENYPEIIQSAIALMQDNDHIYDTVDELCEQLPYSRMQILNAFKKYTGKTMIKFFTDLKLEKAYNLLVSTNYKILHICSLVGFDSISYFNKQFKLRYGVTPSSIRSRST